MIFDYIGGMPRSDRGVTSSLHGILEREVHLRWVEIVNVRVAATTAPSTLEGLFGDIRRNITSGAEGVVRLVIYRGSLVDSDWAIHIHRETAEGPMGRTALGLELADVVRPVGLVDHSIWIEAEGSEVDERTS